MLLGLPPARYVVMAHYEAKLRQLLETANDMDGSLPLEYEIATLEVQQLLNTSTADCQHSNTQACQACQLLDMPTRDAPLRRPPSCNG
jgi:hypothetical protein